MPRSGRGDTLKGRVGGNKNKQSQTFPKQILLELWTFSPTSVAEMLKKDNLDLYILALLFEFSLPFCPKKTIIKQYGFSAARDALC